MLRYTACQQAICKVSGASRIRKFLGSNCADLLNFGLKIICLIIFCDDWRNLRENYSSRVAVDFGCGCAALERKFLKINHLPDSFKKCVLPLMDTKVLYSFSILKKKF
ncbi:hypothetical protein [Caldithrix abyssi]|uniref:hypothetical protein n=1 Tax=Caldithrix abyssi TaxID=187145 RepID=UPI0005C4BBCC|nr:hypothetical protein [Caldithrix abyssi]